MGSSSSKVKGETLEGPGRAKPATSPLSSLPIELLEALGSHLSDTRDRCSPGVMGARQQRWAKLWHPSGEGRSWGGAACDAALAFADHGVCRGSCKPSQPSARPPRRMALACSFKAAYEAARQSAAFWGSLELGPTREAQVSRTRFAPLPSRCCWREGLQLSAQSCRGASQGRRQDPLSVRTGSP